MKPKNGRPLVSPGSLDHRDEEIEYSVHRLRFTRMKLRRASMVFLNHKLSIILRRKLSEMSVREAMLSIKK